MSNLSRPLILDLDFHCKFKIVTDWDENGKIFLHNNGQIITHAIRLLNALSKLESFQYQEIPSNTMGVIQTKLNKKNTKNKSGEPDLHNQC